MGKHVHQYLLLILIIVIVSNHISVDMRNLLGYAEIMITSFAHKGLENFFYNGTKKGIQPKQADKIAGILDRLDAAGVIKDMNFPGSHLHLLEPKKKGRWAVNVAILIYIASYNL